MTNDLLQFTHSLIHSLTHLRTYSFTHILIYAFTLWSTKIDQSMQNKANFMENRVDVSYDKSRGYENTHPVFSPKIPNPISPGVQMNLTPVKTTHYALLTTN